MPTFTPLLHTATQFAIQTHDVAQKQKRKGKDVAYITHPLTVGLILAKAGAKDEIIAAGILHDVIEDSAPEHKVTYDMLVEHFGVAVAEAVNGVTEQNRALPWKERKAIALEHIHTMSEAVLWVKSADVISNLSEILDDYQEDGDATFERFNAPKEDVIANYQAVMRMLIARWEEVVPGNPLRTDLRTLLERFETI